MTFSSFFKATFKTVFSKFFLICFVIWIAMVFVFSVVGVGFAMNTPGVDYKVPDSSISSVFQISGYNLTYTAQNINQYGEGISGTEVYYNLSASSDSSGSILQHVSGGYVGTTNASGFIQFNLPVSQFNEQYYLYTQFHNAANGFEQNSSSFLSTTTSSGTSGSGTLGIVPVKSATDPGTFALHIWSVKGVTYRNATVVYQSSPLISNLFSYPSPFNQSRAVQIARINLTFQENVQTGIPITGHTYYYLAGMENSAGQLESSTYFQTVPSQSMLATQSVGIIFGTSMFIAIFCTFFLVIALSTDSEQRKKWLERSLPEGFPDSNNERRSSLFLHRVSVTTASSVPIVAVTGIFAFFSSSSQFGEVVSITPVLLYSIAMLFSIAISASYVSRLLGTGFVKNVSRESDEYKKANRRMMLATFPLMIIEIIFFDMNSTGLLYSAYNPFPVVLANYFNPFNFVNPLLQLITSSVTFGTPYTFNPNSFGLSFEMVFLVAVIWLLVMVVLPFIWFRHKDQNMKKDV